jgi:hypothetical protein
MRLFPSPPIPSAQQLNLLPALTGPRHLSPDERREIIALLAALLVEAGAPATLEATDERD